MSKEEEWAKNLKKISTKEEDRIPAGLCYVEEFVTEEEEKALMEFFEGQEWDSETPLERRTQQWGYAFDYTEMTVVSNTKQFPPILDPIITRMMKISETQGDGESKLGTYPYTPSRPTQLIVNEYTVGQGIHAHLDRSCFGECVATLALGSQCTFVLDKVEESNTTVLNDFSKMPAYAKTGALAPTSSHAKSLYFPRRAIIMMKGSARYDWTHMIPQGTFDVDPSGTRVPRTKRISLTFRTLTARAEDNVGRKMDLSAAWKGKAVSANDPKKGQEKEGGCKGKQQQ
eukprot:TRINITY_DN10255_c2_g1_i2.p1 TRINITY_DN10255_c2_g1~~TRINITY_DN10255_c2_g1_i2.p1  ORF type:complete len:286 (+),score=47.04 TRINITY_DN10255_c2_g1_i2:236-1093(+)